MVGISIPGPPPPPRPQVYESIPFKQRLFLTTRKLARGLSDIASLMYAKWIPSIVMPVCKLQVDGIARYITRSQGKKHP